MRKQNETTREAYKGYLIILNSFTGSWYVSKDGFHITATRTLDEAKREVEGLVS